MQKKSLWMAISVGIFLVILGTGLAEALVSMKGSIEYVEGLAQLQKKGETGWVGVLLGMEVKEGDRITTLDDSLIEIRLEDGSQIRIAPSSSVEIGTMTSAGEKTTKSLKLWWGRLRARIEKLKTKDSSFEISSPTGVAGVRGTDIAAGYFPDGIPAVKDNPGCPPKTTIFDVYETSTVSIINLTTGETITAGAGMSYIIIPGMAIRAGAIVAVVPISAWTGSIGGLSAAQLVALGVTGIVVPPAVAAGIAGAVIGTVIAVTGAEEAPAEKPQTPTHH